MRTHDSGSERQEHDLVPVETLEKIADAHAFELWGENVGRGSPIPLSDADGVYAYVYPYIRDTKEFPPDEVVFGQVRALRRRFEIDAETEHVPDAYYAELLRIGNSFGSVCVSARYADTPVLWMSHFLAAHFLLLEWAHEEASQRLGSEEARLSTCFYYSPEEQYIEFALGPDKVVVNAAAPRRDVPEDALRTRPSPPVTDETALQIRDSWARLTSSSPVDMISERASPTFAPGTGVAPVGLRIEEIAQTHTSKKIAYWELIPKISHTSKNWCVPTSWAMLLGFYDNYVKGKGTVLGYGRLIDYWYELTPGGHNLPNLIDELLKPPGAAQTNNYAFPEKKTNGDKATQWNTLKGETDAGRPCFFNIPGHTTLAFGYRVSNSGDKYAIVYDPPNPSCPTYEREYNLQECIGIGAVTLSGGTDAENLIIIEPDGGETFYRSAPSEIVWFVWGNSIKKTRMSLSQDGGNTWQVVSAGIPTQAGWNSYAWVPGGTGTRVRLRVEGLTAGNSLIAADGSFNNLEIKSSKAGNAWSKIWGPTDQVLASSMSGKPGLLLYATPANGDGIYRYDGSPMAWTKIGGPGKMFALDDHGHLYGTSPDGGGVFRYDGSPMKWTQIGGPTGAIYAGGGVLFTTNPQTGDIYQYSGKPMVWGKIGRPGKTFTVDGKGRLYGVSPDGSAVYRYDGTPMAWTKIGGKCSAVFAGGCGLYAACGTNNEVFCYSLAPSLWTKVGGPGKTFAVDDEGRLYGLSPDGSGVFRYDGAWNAPQEWTRVGGAAGMIFAGGKGRLFATSPQTSNLMSFEKA